MMPATESVTLDADRRRPWRIALIALAAIVALVGAGLAATASPLFAARTIRVHGATHLTRDDVLRLAGISVGTNLFYLDGASAARALERDAWVAGATITKDLPSTVVVDVQERTAVAIARVGGVMRLVADDGMLLDAAAADALLPTIAAADGAPQPSAGAVGAAAQAIAAMAPDTRVQVAGVSILPDGSLLVRLSGGAVVTYGSADDLEAKAVSLRALLRWAAGQGEHLTAADVHVPSNPTAEVAPGAEQTP
jgi:cell division protein FtsQ